MPNESARATILAVDAVASNVDVLRQLLPEYRIATVKSAEELFEMLRSGLQPDLILLDAAMPGQDAFEVCRRLKTTGRWRSIPVIFVAGAYAPEHETRALEAGAVDCLSKPFEPAIVRARLRIHVSVAATIRKLERDNRLLEEQVAERTVQLEDALGQLEDASHEMILRLSRAAEYKDEDTGAHVVRMGHYAAATARQLGLGEPAATLLLRAAPLHDVGKIGVPDRLLLKRGRLDPEEFEIVKSHTVLGAHILSGSKSEIVRLGAILALSHHERWDGAGYPHGLEGPDIPLPARIVAVADMFDALVSRRPYKDPLPLDVSFDILREKRSAAFDPAVLDAFLAIESEVIDILASYQDVTGKPMEMAKRAAGLVSAADPVIGSLAAPSVS